MIRPTYLRYNRYNQQEIFCLKLTADLHHRVIGGDLCGRLDFLFGLMRVIISNLEKRTIPDNSELREPARYYVEKILRPVVKFAGSDSEKEALFFKVLARVADLASLDARNFLDHDIRENPIRYQTLP